MVEKKSTQSFSPELFSELNRRARILETKTEQLQQKIAELEKNLISYKNDCKIYVNFTQSKINDLLSKLEIIEKEIKHLKISLENCVNKQEIEKLKTMLDLFNPLKSSFVTRNELKEEINKLLNEFKVKKE